MALIRRASNMARFEARLLINLRLYALEVTLNDSLRCCCCVAATHGRRLEQGI